MLLRRCVSLLQTYGVAFARTLGPLDHIRIPPGNGRWTALHPNGSAAIAVLDANIFYPTWDPMQAVKLRSLCEKVESHSESLTSDDDAAWTGGSEAAIAARRSACSRLRADDFVPARPSAGSAFTDHHWMHTLPMGLESQQ